MYVYNADANDGTDCDCTGTPTYCKNIPIAGLDFPNVMYGSDGQMVDMYASMYILNSAPPGAGMGFPNSPIQFYHYMTGSWADGTPLTYGGTGKGGTRRTRYAFPDPPNNPAGWSMVTAAMPPEDYQAVQSYGPFKMQAGNVKEMLFGVPFVPDQPYPAPDLEPLFTADRAARVKFNILCEEIPLYAPDVSWVELDKHIVAVIDGSVAEQRYTIDRLAPEYLPLEATKYKFEGYIIYQLAHKDVQPEEYEDTDKARIVAVSDIQNGISKLYNWEAIRDSATQKVVFKPVEKVAGEDTGIRHTYNITEDKFAQGASNSLINHKRYYYSVVSYAHNNYQSFDPINNKGQRTTFLRSRENIQAYTVIPRPVLDTRLQAAYGEGAEIVRLEGIGSGWKNFLDLTDASRAQLWTPALQDTILTYRPGYGPFDVQIFNPFEVKDGTYELKFTDKDPQDTRLENDARWQLRLLPDGPVIASAATISEVNEQIIDEYGFSVLVAHASEPGTKSDPDYGFIGGRVAYKNPASPWLQHYVATDFPPFNYLLVSNGERDRALDPGRAIEKVLKNGYFMPYAMYDWHLQSMVNDAENRLFTAAWTEGSGRTQGNLNALAIGAVVDTNGVLDADRDKRVERFAALPNVDIVLTNDKSKWSRCVVIETASLYYTSVGDPLFTLRFPKDPALLTETGPNGRPRLMFDTRPGLSVGQEDANNDGLPDPDGAIAPVGAPDAGKPLRGMGWFPGYAIDVETGQRLNIFFGENSVYHQGLDPNYTGRDMLWNPTAQSFRVPVGGAEYYDFVGGGQHWIYVMNRPYDGCEAIRRRLTPELNVSPAAKVTAVRDIGWTGMLQLASGTRMLSLREGLVPQETIFKLRVGNQFQTGWNDRAVPIRKNGIPAYQFTLQNKMAGAITGSQAQTALDSIAIIPNPYYAFSDYESGRNESIVKIANLPPFCKVTIYTLSGNFVRQFEQNEMYQPYQQIGPAIEWDLKNHTGKPIASGLYLIHINAPGRGERTLKWMGIMRQTGE